MEERGKKEERKEKKKPEGSCPSPSLSHSLGSLPQHWRPW